MVPMVVHGVHPVHGLMGVAGEELVLRLLRPKRCMPGRVFVVPALHFLEEQDVRLHRGKCLLQCVDPRHAAQGADAFMDVIRRNAKFHGIILDAAQQMRKALFRMENTVSEKIV